MRKGVLIYMVIPILLAACSKEKAPPLSGTVTINNDLFGSGPYYAYGFSFALAEKLPTSSRPYPDITVDNDGTPDNLILQSNNLNNSYFLAGEYDSAESASVAFDNLTGPVVNDWIVWAFGIKPHQVWVFRTGDEKYAKIRIISVVSELRQNRYFAECTFEWVFQPDGTLTFPPG